MRIGQIINMGAVEADGIRERAVAGDLLAAKDYVLYGTWKKLRALAGLTRREKIKVISELSSMELTWLKK